MFYNDEECEKLSKETWNKIMNHQGRSAEIEERKKRCKLNNYSASTNNNILILVFIDEVTNASLHGEKF